MRAAEVQAGDVYIEDDGKWMVRDVKRHLDQPKPTIELRLAAGRTDFGTWYEFDAEADLSIWRAYGPGH